MKNKGLPGAALAASLVALSLAGCALSRSGSSEAPGAGALPAATPVLISEGVPAGRQYREIGPIEVSVKKMTIFNKDPSKEQANEALREKARAMGADAVIKVVYKTGVGFTTWGYIDASGTAVKLNK